MTSTLCATGISKRYLRVEAGEIYGFLGRNGAGKTTTIRILLGLIRPSSGEVSLLGHSLRRERLQALAKVGYLVESASAYPNLSARENLDLQRRLTGAPSGSVERVLGLLHLEEYADRRSAHLSLGNKQRLSLARALVHSPDLLILDEPTNGLDPAGIVEIRDLLTSLAAGGTTIFISSHILPEVAKIAQRIGIVHAGRLVEEVGPGALGERRRLGLEVAVDRPEAAAARLGEALGLRDIAIGDGGVLRVDDPRAEAAEVARVLVGASIRVNRLLPLEEGLEERFLRLTGGRS